MNKPTQKEIEEAIKYLTTIIKSLEFGPTNDRDNITTALSILLHVKEHGLALTDGEIFNTLDNVGACSDIDEYDKRVSKAIATKQKGLL